MKIDMLVAEAAGLGWRVEFKGNINTDGYCRPSNRRIVIKSGGRTHQQILETLTRELDHARELEEK